MGFLTGTTTFTRYRIAVDPTNAFGDQHLETLKKFRIGASKTNLMEKPNVGFSGGAHLLDTQFDLEKNIIGEAMHFGIRIDSCQIPGPIKNAWMKIELAGIMTDNAGSRPSKSQREEAKEAVDARCVAESEKGNFKRMSETSVLWDAVTGTLFLSSTSEKNNEMCLGLLERAFELEFSQITSSKLIHEFADESDQYAKLQNVSPTPFLPDEGAAEVVWWNGMSENFDYLGNEFFLWLWWQWESQSDTIKLSDQTEVTGMFARSLSLECPRGEWGKESISSESPVTLVEAVTAIRMGKLPRKAGLTLVREGTQYDLTLQAETFGINGARISFPGDSTTESRDHADRIESIRQLNETIDLLFDVFCEKRIGSAWNAEAKKMTQWLQAEQNMKKRRLAA